jgi:3-hydroxymyristoyl/3-hydroxydecanoyl-(acyl carrier protein) dehydratase
MEKRIMNSDFSTRKIKSHNSSRLIDLLDGYLSRSSEMHQAFLENQMTALETITEFSRRSESGLSPSSSNPAIFSREQLEEFSNGTIARCFGPDYAILDQRPTPRIPNGRLLLIDRVIEISGKRMQIDPPASIVTELDVPPDAWYFPGNPYQGLPLSMLLEMALQPCGILSAYLGTSLVLPAENHLFRNLDGWITQASQLELLGKTITNRAELTKSVASGGLYIQTYRFSLSTDGQVFLEGESSFGYFTDPVMKNQSGLDLGKKQPGSIRTAGFPDGFTQVRDFDSTSRHLLDLTDQTWIHPTGGKYGLGLVTGLRAVDPDDWFFENHFYGDPVMPGSLGVESITRGLAVLTGQISGNHSSNELALDLSADQPLKWKYRGQVLPTNELTYFEAHIKQMTSNGGQIRILADADFWVDDLRIYTIENLSMVLKEGMK